MAEPPEPIHVRARRLMVGMIADIDGRRSHPEQIETDDQLLCQFDAVYQYLQDTLTLLGEVADRIQTHIDSTHPHGERDVPRE